MAFETHLREPDRSAAEDLIALAYLVAQRDR